MQKKIVAKNDFLFVAPDDFEAKVKGFVADAEKYFFGKHPGKRFGIKFCTSRNYQEEREKCGLTGLRYSEMHILEIRNNEIAKLTFAEIAKKYTSNTALPSNLTADDIYLMLHLH